jgi:hypothetical protein
VNDYAVRPGSGRFRAESRFYPSLYLPKMQGWDGAERWSFPSAGVGVQESAPGGDNIVILS